MKVCCPNCQHEFDFNPYGGVDSPLRSARREKGLTVNQAAAELAISPFSLQNLERGRMNPRMSTIRLAVKLYNKSIEELFPEPEEDESTEESEDEAV